MVGFFISPAAQCGNLTRLLCVSLVPFLEETMSKMCLFKIGQYCLALLNSMQREDYESLFEDLLVQFGLFLPERSLGNSFGLLFYGLVYQDLY